jgi:hypothetical protein
MDHSARSALGDWSGIKGTHYHLLYALYLLVVERVQEVSFYDGNDLRATPTPPPTECGDGPVRAMARSEDRDIWVQLKCTDQGWTPTRVIKDLLRNFALNLASSASACRESELRLVSPGGVDAKGLQRLIASPNDNQRLCEVAQDVEKALNKGVRSGQRYEDGVGLVLCSRALKQLLNTQPMAVGTLKALIELELVVHHHDRRRAQTIASQLISEMLDAASVSSRPTVFTEKWADEILGTKLVPNGLFDRSVREACDAQVTNALELLPEWDGPTCIAREGLDADLDQFMASTQTVYVLTGPTDSGKTWGLARFALEHLQGRVRCWCDGRQLPTAGGLADLVHSMMAPHSQASLMPMVATSMWLSAATDAQPAVLLVDDLRESDPASRSSHHVLGKLIRECGRHHVKVVLTVGETELCLRWPTGCPTLSDCYRGDADGVAASFTLGAPTDAEVAKLQSGTAPRPSIAQLRAALGPDSGIRAYRLALQSAVADWQQELARLLDTAAVRAGVASHEMLEAAEALVTELWLSGQSGLKPSHCHGVLQSCVGDRARDVLHAVQSAGIVSGEECVKVRETILTYELVASGIRTDLARLSRGSPVSMGPLVRLLEREPGDVAGLAQQLCAYGQECANAACEGISRRACVTVNEASFVIGQARTQANGESLNRAACRALGRMAQRSTPVRAHLKQYLVDGTGTNGWIAQIALGSALPQSPQWVRELLDGALAAGGASSSDQNRTVGLVLGVVEQVPFPEGREAVVDFLKVLSQDALVRQHGARRLAELRGKWGVLDG